jgi:hypothetical protein
MKSSRFKTVKEPTTYDVPPTIGDVVCVLLFPGRTPRVTCYACRSGDHGLSPIGGRWVKLTKLTQFVSKIVSKA